jgi:putative molybdopterin biosynthesis protein
LGHEHGDADPGRHDRSDPADAARLANVSRDTIYREVQRGALPAKHVGRQLRIDPADFTHYLKTGQGMR